MLEADAARRLWNGSIVSAAQLKHDSLDGRTTFVDERGLMPHSLPTAAVMFILGLIPHTLVWVAMARIVRAHGHSFSPWNYAMITNLRSVHQILRQERGSGRSSPLRWLVTVYYASLGWCLVWFIVLATARSRSG